MALDLGGDFKMNSEKTLHMIAFTLLVVGGLNWGLVGLLHINLVSMLFGNFPPLEMVAYLMIGLSAIYLTITHMSDCKTCKME